MSALRAELARLYPAVADVLDQFDDEELVERLEGLADTDPAIGELLDRFAGIEDDEEPAPEPVVVTIGLGEAAPEVVLTRPAGIEVRMTATDGTPVVLRSLAPTLLAAALKRAASEVNSTAHRARMRR